MYVHFQKKKNPWVKRVKNYINQLFKTKFQYRTKFEFLHEYERKHDIVDQKI